MKKDLIYRLFSRIPPMETERLSLRAMRVSDTADMYAYARLPEVTAYLTWNVHESEEETRAYLEYVGQRYRTGDFYDWAVICKADGHMIGTCGFTSFNYGADTGEIGYVLNPAYTGRGLATEAVEAVLGFGFHRLSLNRIEAHYIEGNASSRALMERVGMQYEGMARELMKIKGQYRNIGTCAILRRDYEAREPL